MKRTPGSRAGLRPGLLPGLLAALAASTAIVPVACGDAAAPCDPDAFPVVPDDPTRPRVHFTPPAGWMNDPNGLVVADGRWHLFYQHNPDDVSWGPMHWGHAVGDDPVTFAHRPVALAPDPERGWIYSGSAVVATGAAARALCGAEAAADPACLVAAYTHQDWAAGTQSQSLAASTDRGETWVPYAGNPVLADPTRPDFRDPKVFRHAPTDAWVMVVAAGDRALFYRSPDLVEWTPSGAFGPVAGMEAAWECPDLFPLDVAGREGDARWVFKVDSGRARYFVGTFDGTAFASPDAPRFVDGAPDFYAAQSWSDAPDGRRTWIAWMNAWEYAGATPADGWRGAMTLARDLALAVDGARVDLVQRPVAELDAWLGPAWDVPRDIELPAGGNVALGRGDALDLRARLRPGPGGEMALVVLADDEAGTRVGFDAAAGTLFLDRTDAGTFGHGAFARRFDVPVVADEDGAVSVRVIVDRGSVEVFAMDGRAVLTGLAFPAPGADAVRITTGVAGGRVDGLVVRPLRPPGCGVR